MPRRWSDPNFMVKSSSKTYKTCNIVKVLVNILQIFKKRMFHPLFFYVCFIWNLTLLFIYLLIMYKKCKMCDIEISPNRTYCSNKCKFSDKDYNRSRISMSKNDDTLTLKCKYCDWTTNDNKNKSGICTRHLREHKIYSFSFDHFNEEIITPPDTWDCPMCDWKTTDADNKSGCITNHVKQHNITLVKFISKYPSHRFSSKKLEHKISISHSSVSCKICDKKMKMITNSHLRTHNITQEEYKRKYGNIITSSSTVKKLKRLGGTKHVKFSSNAETEIYEYLTSLGLVLKQHDKSLISDELDMVSYDHNIAIEFNGNYWHSEHHGGKFSKYHLYKTEACERIGFQLIHIFEDEWNLNNDIIKNRLKNIFGKFDGTVVYGRKCIIKEIEPTIKNAFLDKYHLQGQDSANVKLGAYYDGVLVSVMTFSKKRIALGYKNSNEGYELSRFATNYDYKVIGIFGKMLKYFISKYNPSNIITYADRRFSKKENIYTSNGFEYVNSTKPNYFYMYRHGKREHRYNYRKHILKDKLNLFDPNLSEWENMKNNNYDRIWDCGSHKYELNIHSDGTFTKSQ